MRCRALRIQRVRSSVHGKVRCLAIPKRLGTRSFRYNNGSVLGYNVDLTWFRDIRRYVAHCQKQGEWVFRDKAPYFYRIPYTALQVSTRGVHVVAVTETVIIAALDRAPAAGSTACVSMPS